MAGITNLANIIHCAKGAMQTLAGTILDAIEDDGGSIKGVVKDCLADRLAH